jgi:hypothetical protein
MTPARAIDQSPAGRPRLGPMDLVGRPYAFTQRRLLEPEEFAREAGLRGVHLTSKDLDGLHQTHLLDPLYRVRRPEWDIQRRRRAVGRPYRQPSRMWGVPKTGAELRLDHADGLLADAAGVPYRTRARAATGGVRRSEYLYSTYQLLELTRVDRGRELLARARTSSKGDATDLERLRKFASKDRSLVALLEALEPIYLPDIVLHHRTSILDGERAYEDYLRGLDHRSLLEETGWTPEELYEAAAGLLREASILDPLAPWLELVRQVHPDHWLRLKGAARLAIDQRIAAEMILRFVEDLQAVGAAKDFPSIPPLASHELNERLRRDRKRLDEVLTYYDLSPYPSVVLSLEGETEVALVPLVMEALGMPRRDSFVRLVNAHGENRDHALLATYAALPHLGPRQGAGADFLRPPTRYIVVVDADRSFATPEARETERLRLVDSLWTDLPSAYRTATARTELDSMVLIDSWADGADFERAHFSDRETAEALNRGGYVPGRLSITAVEQQLGQLRGRGSIEDLWKRWPKQPSKPDLALLLWPVLEARIREAGSDRPTLDAIPVVRVLLRTWELALGTLRRNVMMRIDESAP